MIFLATTNAHLSPYFVQTRESMHRNCAQIKTFAQIFSYCVHCVLTMHKICVYLKSYAHVYERFTRIKVEFEEQLKEEQKLNTRILENLKKIES